MTASRIDADAVTALLREAASDIVMPRYKSLAQHEIIEKNPGDLVTVADLEAEHFLTPKLAALLPGSEVVGEEAHAREPEILHRFSGDAPVWLIDPVDGTKNFTNGSETFCMMVALVVKNRPVMAWIHHPLTGQTTVAEEGSGAYRAGERLTVPSAPPDKAMIGQINSWYFPRPQAERLRTASRQRFREVSSLSCAGMDYVSMAQGGRHFSFFRRLWPWDHAPGVLILREAGGHADRIDGTPYRAGDRVHGILNAPDKRTWKRLRSFLLEREG